MDAHQSVIWRLSMQQTITGKLSIDRLRIQYYPAGVEQITIPDATVTEYLRTHCPGLDKRPCNTTAAP